MECVYILESVNVMKAGLMKVVHEVRTLSLYVKYVCVFSYSQCIRPFFLEIF